MKIIEIFANRRSGHHFFMSWLVSNLSGIKDSKIKNLNKITWITDKICHYNDATYHAFFDEEKVKYELKKIIDKKPEYLLINYEESDIYNSLNCEGSLIESYKPKKIIFIRDFYNTMASKWKVSNTDLKEFYFGFEKNEQIMENIKYWKIMAKNYLMEGNEGIKYEDLLNNQQRRVDFLKNNFKVKEKFTPDNFKGTKSSFESKNYNERYREVNFSENFIRLAQEDDELNYLIGSLKYDFKKL